MAASWNSGGGRDPAVAPVDQTYGQRSVFGGANQTTAPADDELDIEDEQDALDYLRVVRAEARKIPHVLVAQKYGPQAFPAHLAGPVSGLEAAPEQAAPASRRRRRRRHWDEQEDGFTGSSNKKRRVSRQQAVAVELSYDDEGGNDAGQQPSNGDSLDYDDEGGNDDYDDDEPDADYEEDGLGAEDKDSCVNKGAVNRDIYESGIGDARGYYQDGAYTAAPDPAQNGHADGGDAVAAAGGTTDSGKGRSEANSNGAGSSVSSVDAQFTAVYRAHLLARFATIRALLHQSPPPTADVLAGLPPDHDVDVGPLSTRSGAFRRWMHLLQTTDPLPAQIAAMDKVSVFRLLRIILRGLLAGGSSASRSSRSAKFARQLAGGKGSLDVSPRTSRWLWALFARLPTRGELDYREVGYIREVAKQAVMRLAHLSYDVGNVGEPQEAEEGEVEEEQEDEEPYGNGGEWDMEEAGEVAEATPQNETVEEAQAEVEDWDDAAMDVESEPEQQPGTEEQAEERARDDGLNPAGGAPGEAAPERGPGADTAADEDVDMHQRATLEMVLAVAGEFYGQRDLLAFRSPWPASAER